MDNRKEPRLCADERLNRTGRDDEIQNLNYGLFEISLSFVKS